VSLQASNIVEAGTALLSLGLGCILALVMRRYMQRLAPNYSSALDGTQTQAAELEAIRRQHELLLNSIDEGIYGLDRQGCITFINPAAARMLGWEVHDLLGQPMHARLHHTQADGAPYPPERCPIIATLRDGAVQQVVNDVFWRKDGAPLPVEYVSSPIVDAGAITGAVVVCRDISERRRLEAQLIHAQKLESIGRLTGGIAHDFNNLLTTIGGCVELARDTLPDTHVVQADLRAIRDATDRAAALTRHLLSFARKQAIATQTFSLNDMLHGIEPLLRRTLGADIALAIHPAPDIAPIHADPNQIEQVLLNLAINARDAMPGGGKLTVETANVELDGAYTQQHPHVRPGCYVMLAVSDTGHGIPPEAQAQIFEPFFTTKEAGKGTGLGLSTSYGIVQQHGGTIGVYSEAGHGATFKVYLPPAVSETSAPGAPAALPWGSETLLLVDDQEPMRALAARVLRDHGYTVLEAATGEAGLMLAQAHAGPLDLLLTDVVLPKLGGTELAERIAAERPGIKILFVSGYPERALIHQGRLALEATVLHKPFAASALLHGVRAALDQQLSVATDS
jgi:hypothetical protein